MQSAVKPKKPKGSPRDLSRLLSYIKPYRVRFAVALFCLFVASSISLTPPLIVRSIIDAASVERNVSMLNNMMLLLFGIYAVQAAFAFSRSYLLSYIGERVVADVRTQVYKHLTRLPLSFFASRRVGELTSRMASDVTVIQTVITGALPELLRQSLLLVGGTAIIVAMNPRLTLMMFFVVPVLMVSAALYRRYIRSLTTDVQDRLADANSVLDEVLSSVSTVQSFVREDYELERYRGWIARAFSAAIRRALANGGFIAFIVLVVNSGISLVLWFGSRMVASGAITAGELVAFLLYTYYVGSALGSISELYGQFQHAIGASRRIFEILDTKSDIVDPERPAPFDHVRGDVEVRQVHFRYPGERKQEVLKGVSVTARAGELIALVGPSGAGKSTLVSLIPRFYDITSGAVFIDGTDVRDVRVRDLREAVGMVSQEPALFAATVRENIAYGRLNASESEIKAAAQAANAHEFIKEFPDGYETLVGERGVKLSGGQRQRIAIARALLKNPSILILDEATSSLDSESERLVQDALETLMRGRTTFVIAHRLSTVRRADKIVVLDNGKIVEQGDHETLLSNNGLYKKLYEIQFRDYPVLARSVSDTE